ELGEVEQRAAEAVYLVDHDEVHLAVRDVGQQPLEGGPVRVGTREAAIVVALRQAGPALAGLTPDEGFSRLALSIEAVDLLGEALLGALAGVDGAAHQGERDPRRGLGRLFLHCCSPWRLRRKNKNPLQCEPVMALATAESEA